MSYFILLACTAGAPALPHRLLAICDISADPGGSIEFMNECTTIDEPFCLYDADRNKDKKTFKGPGVLICSIDNMPTQLPMEATDFFGEALFPHVDNILKSDATKTLDAAEMDKMGPIVSNAVITSNGALAPNFRYISDLRNTMAPPPADLSGVDRKVFHEILSVCLTVLTSGCLKGAGFGRWLRVLARGGIPDQGGQHRRHRGRRAQGGGQQDRRKVMDASFALMHD